jgi:hypothetical protein
VPGPRPPLAGRPAAFCILKSEELHAPFGREGNVVKSRGLYALRPNHRSRRKPDARSTLEGDSIHRPPNCVVRGPSLKPGVPETGSSKLESFGIRHGIDLEASRSPARKGRVSHPRPYTRRPLREGALPQREEGPGTERQPFRGWSRPVGKALMQITGLARSSLEGVQEIEQFTHQRFGCVLRREVARVRDDSELGAGDEGLKLVGGRAVKPASSSPHRIRTGTRRVGSSGSRAPTSSSVHCAILRK